MRHLLPLSLALSMSACQPTCTSGRGAAPATDQGAEARAPERIGASQPARLRAITYRTLRRSRDVTTRPPTQLALPEQALLRGRGLMVWHALATPPRLILGREASSTLDLVDLRDGRALTQFERAQAISPRAGVLRAMQRRAPDEAPRPALIALDDGRAQALDAVFDDGRPVARPLVHLHPKSAQIWLFARRDHDHKGYFGPHRPGAAARLERALPFMPNYIRYNIGLDALEVERKLRSSTPAALRKTMEARTRRLERLTLAERPCGRVRISPTGRTDCIAPELERIVSEDAIWLDGPWVSYDADLSGLRPRIGQPTVQHTAGGSSEALLPPDTPCRLSLRTGLERPARILAGCVTGEASEIVLRLWTPEGAITWREGRTWIERIWRTQDGIATLRDWPSLIEQPLLPIGDEGTIWLDMEHGRILSSETPLHTLSTTPGLPRRALAWSGEPAHRSLIVLDSDDATLHTLDARLSCPGDLSVSAQQGPWSLLRCAQEDSVLWQELVDRHTLQRARLPAGVVVDTLLEDGSLIVLSQGGDALWHLKPARE